MTVYPRRFALLLVLLLAMAAIGATIKLPNAAQRAAALGSLDGMPPAMRRAFDARGFLTVPIPGSLDWLANHEEPGQRVDEFIGSHPNLPASPRRKLYLLPLGEIERSGGPPAARLAEFASAFFGLETTVLPALDVSRIKVARRRNAATRTEQLLTTDVLAILKSRLPADAYALLGVTMADLYPAEDWNFVFGQASLRDRVGIYGFSRFDPGPKGERGGDGGQVMLRRSCQILAHEAGHMFGIAHCTWYRCVMNGSNHLAESDGQPLHLCPVDLRKLQWSAGFDIAARYRRLLAFSTAAGFTAEAEWLRARLREIEGR